LPKSIFYIGSLKTSPPLCATATESVVRGKTRVLAKPFFRLPDTPQILFTD
jgi:hypothetical protein